MTVVAVTNARPDLMTPSWPDRRVEPQPHHCVSVFRHWHSGRPAPDPAGSA